METNVGFFTMIDLSLSLLFQCFVINDNVKISFEIPSAGFQNVIVCIIKLFPIQHM